MFGAPFLNTIETFTIWSPEMGNIKGLWNELTESVKKYWNIRKALAVPKNGLSILSY